MPSCIPYLSFPICPNPTWTDSPCSYTAPRDPYIREKEKLVLEVLHDCENTVVLLPEVLGAKYRIRFVEDGLNKNCTLGLLYVHAKIVRFWPGRDLELNPRTKVEVHFNNDIIMRSILFSFDLLKPMFWNSVFWNITKLVFYQNNELIRTIAIY